MKSAFIDQKNCFSIFAVILAVMVAGCASISVNSDYDRSAEFGSLATYAWVPGPQPKSQDPRIDNALLDSRVRGAVDRNLSLKGYEKQSGGEADFWVGYQAAIDEKLDVSTINVPYTTPSSSDLMRGHYSGYSYGSSWGYGSSQTFVSQYEEGTLIVDIVDAKTKKLIWRGTAKAAIDENADPQKREARINTAVEKILSEFPPEIS